MLNSPLGLILARTKVEVVDVRVSGNLAAVDAKLRAPGVKRAQYRTYKLEQLNNGTWLISDVSL